MKLMKLDIQLFASSLGSGSNSKYLYSTYYPSKYPYTLAVSWKENSYNTSNNTSSVTVSGSLTADQNWWETNNHASTLAIYWYDNYTGTEKLVGSTTFYGLSGKYDSKSTSATFTVTHNSNGKLSGYAKAVFTKGNTSTSYACNSGNVSTSTSELYDIPRYANFSTHSIGDITQNSIQVNWSADSDCDSVQYSLNGGSWVSTSGTSYIISGLNPNTTYTIKTRIRRTDSQLWTESGTLTATTLKEEFGLKLKVNGTWKNARPYIKVNGTWKKATPYIKVNGVWEQGIN